MNSGRLEVTDTNSNTSAGKANAVPEIKRNVDRRAGRKGGRAGHKAAGRRK